MNNTKWVYRERPDTKNLDHLNLDRDILNIILNRKLDTPEKIDIFLHGTINNISDPFLLSDIEKSAKFLLGNKHKNIWIYGDYDVDGITSTSISYLSLQNLGFNIHYYIPLRDEGYGLNKDALSYIKEQGGDIVITVDCGISSHEEILHGNSLGLQIIITDHHSINAGLPEAFAVINPKREDNKYTYKFLAGVGTVFMLLLGIHKLEDRVDELMDHLDIVAIGTVADIVPLTEDNRIFTKLGLLQLQNSKNVGIRSLLKVLFETLEDKEFNTYDIGFIIAPVFNAAGRLEDAKKAVELLICKSPSVALEISKQLVSQNNLRKEIQSTILDKVNTVIEKNKLEERNAIVISNPDFHHGVIGIVASKIVDRYYKPVIIMEEKTAKGFAVASCRSIEGFNLIEALNSMSELFLKYGGHAGAAGFSIPLENIDEFNERLNTYVGSKLNSNDFKKPVKIDEDISFNKVSFEFFDKLKKLAPFGFGNPTPLFTVKNCSLDRVRIIGKTKDHIMFDVLKDDMIIKNCAWFGNAHNLVELMNFSQADIAFKLKIETYMDRYMVKMYIEDVREATNDENPLADEISTYDTNFPIHTVIYTRNTHLTEDDIHLNFGDGINLIQNRKNIGYLSSQTTDLIKKLKYDHNFNFKAKIEKIERKNENTNIHISIDKDFSFETFSLKTSNIFKEIKNFLIGDMEYNSIQKKVLSSVYRDKNKNTLLISPKHRGLKTIILTVGIYEHLQNKKVLLISKDKYSSAFSSYMDIMSEAQPGYDYYIYHNTVPNKHTTNSLVISNSDINLDSYYKILDEVTLPTNITLVEEEYILKNYQKHKGYYTKKLSIKNKLNLKKNIKNIENIYSTSDIFSLL